MFVSNFESHVHQNIAQLVHKVHKATERFKGRITLFTLLFNAAYKSIIDSIDYIFFLWLGQWQPEKKLDLAYT